ncbi:MAG TPA: DUF2911 domain-containing protein [Holophagaceae bacterium]|nr:DUF2911 domain-containing protein [Holophagaceae bacterium]
MRLVLPALLSLSLVAQDKPAPVRLTPLRVSPAATLTQDLGISQIKLSFARPAVKGRKIWGEVVPFGQVWRTGANAATNLTFSHPCKVAGKEIPAGTYALFAIPTEKAWTLILSKQAQIWGAYDYKQDQDVMRFEVMPEVAPFQEYLDYRVQVEDLDHARVELTWEKLRVAFPVAFDGKAIYWKHLEDTLAKAPDTDLVPWYQAAQYCFQTQTHQDKALAWSEKSVKIGESMWNYENRGRVLHWAGRTAEAIPFMEKAAALSRGKAPKEWTENVEKDVAAWKASLKSK